MTTIERIKELSRKNGWSLQTVAEKAGIGINSIYRWKTQVPSTQSLRKVADVFGVSVDDLLGTEQKKKVDDPTTLVAAHIDDDIDDATLKDIIDYIEFKKKQKKE